MNHRERAEKFREDNGWPWCGECELDDSCHGCEVGLKDLAAAFAEVETEALERAASSLDKYFADWKAAHDKSNPWVQGMAWDTMMRGPGGFQDVVLPKRIRALKEKP